MRPEPTARSEREGPLLGPWVFDRFWANVRRVAKSSCWIWLGREQDRQGRPGGGYGIISAKAPGGKWLKLYAHRLSFLLHHGSLPEPPFRVLHRCDVRLCVNPDHLFVGTDSDNMVDARHKGRLTRLPRGEDHWKAVLSKRAVREIREALSAGDTRAALAVRYGVGETAISKIKRRATWAHVA